MFDIPFLDLPPMQAAHGTVRLPGSKSISNRVLLLAGLSAGCTRIHELLDSDDTRVMLQALRTLGCEVQQEPASVAHAASVSPASPPEMADRTTAAPGEAARTGPVWRVTGLGGQLKVRQAQLFLGNAGTAMRPLTAALALLAATQGGRFELSGVARMHERPIGDLVDALRPLGCRIEDLGQPGYPPLRVWGEAGGLLALHRPIRVRGDVSSQFLTALLLALPLASAQAEPVIEVEGELISKPYIEITLNMLARFGIEVQREGFERFLIPRGSQYRSPGDIHVEGDASSASYFIALGALAAGEGRSLRVEGVGAASVQGDIRFVEAAQAMGASVTSSANALQVRRGAWPLHPITMDCNAIPDAAMTLAVMALYASGPSRLNNIGSWRVKETDRIAAMACELRKLGAQVHEGPDFIEIHPPAPAQWRSASLRTYDDHRMAMCLSLAAFNPLAGAQPPATLRIQDPRCVAKTFPDYFETLFEVAQASPGLIPVIAVDGPSASGKGTLSQALAQRLGYRLLDSGAIYRAAGVAAQRAGLDPEDAGAVAALARQLALRFEGERVLIDDQDLTEEVRSEQGGLLASRVSVHPEVRAALHELQLSFRQLPGLVADGRDMGTVVFPDAPLKVFLTASAEQRAERRHKQLISKGIPANIRDLLADLRARDARDASRASSPLKPAEDALLLDNSNIGIDQSVDQVLGWWAKRRPF